ncbi:MAG TPA: DUF1990 family protein [Longimicrobiaceae bacterium]|nr:DUF1990 family protein [Longimicrobiaceae bacterium]
MAEWRIGRGWSDVELATRLDRLGGRGVNFDADQSEMSVAAGWNEYASEALIARESSGPPIDGGPFQRAEIAVANYQFSDPRIVVGHFDSESRLLGRRMLLEMTALRVFHYLGGVVVNAVRFEEQDGQHVFGFRYDTLTGHLERGSEWFTVTKDVRSGEIRFRVEAAWLPGDFPNGWSRLGFKLLGPYYQRRWHHEAHQRLFEIARGTQPATAPRDAEGLAHAGLTIVFERTQSARVAEGPIWQEEETIQSS